MPTFCPGVPAGLGLSGFGKTSNRQLVAIFFPCPPGRMSSAQREAAGWKKKWLRPSPQPLKVAGSTDHLAHDTHTSSLQAIAPSLSRASAPHGLQRCIFRSKHRFRGGSGTMGVWYPSPLPLCAKQVENGKPRKGPSAVRGLPGTSLPWGRHRGSRAKVQAQNAPFWPSGAKGARVPLFLARWQPRGWMRVPWMLG